MRPRILLALGVLAAVLIALLAVEYRAEALQDAGRSAGSGRRAFVQAGAPAGAAAESANAVHALADTILHRPLFRSDRRPPAANGAAAVAAPLPRLSGVLVSSVGKSLIFSGGASGKPIVVSEGGRIGSYRVQSIGVGEAIVAGPDGIRTLRPAFGEHTAAGRPVPAVAVLAQPSILDQLRNALPPSVGIPGLSMPAGAPSLGTSSHGTPSSGARQ